MQQTNQAIASSAKEGSVVVHAKDALRFIRYLISLGLSPHPKFTSYITHLEIAVLHRWLHFLILYIYKHAQLIYKIMIGEFVLSFLQTQLNFHRSLILDHWIVVYSLLSSLSFFVFSYSLACFRLVV